MRRLIIVLILVAITFATYPRDDLGRVTLLSASALERQHAVDAPRGPAGSLSGDRRQNVARSFTARPRGPRDGFSPAPGQPVFRIVIPAIGVDERVVQGTNQDQLAKAPGHYPECGNGFSLPYCTEFEEVWPGERGRVVVGGHRTLGTRPFFDVGELAAGDQIIVHARWGRFRYVVRERKVVGADDRSIIVPGVRRRELVLVTCHPKFSAAQRLLVFSELVRRPPGGHDRTAT